MNLTAGAIDDPDVNFYESYACGSERNYTKYCNREVENLIDQQSHETEPEKRRQLVWAVERKLAEDVARPIMGTDPERSVVNEWGRCHDVKNLFIVDGSIWVTSGGVNPTSTIQALALYIADQMKQRLATLFD